MNEKFCQCCGMPMLNSNELYGTNEDGTINNDYCKYCFDKGVFTFEGTMEEMIDICVPHVLSTNTKLSEKEAMKMMSEWFPTLKRWKK